MDIILKQNQELSLLMTPELRQAIELLQYSNYELYQFINEQEIDNPLLKLEDQNNDYVFEKKTKNKGNSTKSNYMDSIKIKNPNLKDNLIEQVRFLTLDKRLHKLVEYLIYNLDDNGYLILSSDLFIEAEAFTDDEINEGIQIIRKIGPLGIGARNLQECLLLQITTDFPDQKIANELIQNHLELLANRKWGDIALIMGITLPKLKEVHEYILTLNPRPCSSISNFETEYINPDIIVKVKKMEISYYLNDGYLPTIHFNHDYAKSLNNNEGEIASYISSQYKSYQWLVNGIEQRRKTILKIVAVIIEKQKKFFTDGFLSLIPLTLKEIAHEIGMHESTISRATANKIIQTPKGTFELRKFFSSKIETSNGDSISQIKVKNLLKSLIKNENKFNPLSDQEITNYFITDQGINISRRTISKYRSELNIPSSNKRKEIEI
ncbi:RNA polymerase factor sigma-54 [Psychrobacillus sp. BM2]|uniref:RNA polymerase factor sigma-54 n=1 Tax=Psychrobacillus sp. BM2 TaxID=3400421 RepID=UPI003B026BCE